MITMMKKLCFLFCVAIAVLVAYIQVFGAGFYEAGTPMGGYPSNPSFVTTSTNSLQVKDNVVGSGGTPNGINLGSWAFSYISSLGGAGLKGNVAGDNTGRLQFYNFGAANYTDNGFFNRLQVKSGPFVMAETYSDLVAAIAGATGKTLLISTAVSVTDNTVLDSTVELWILRGGSISIASGKKLTINGPFLPGPNLRGIFTGAGTVEFGVGSVDKIYPQWWPNCLPDGSTDCKAAYLAAANAAYHGAEIHISPGKWKIATALRFPEKLFHLRGEGTRSVLWIQGLAGDNAIRAGTEDGAANYIYGYEWKDFAILGGDNSCATALTLVHVLNSKFERIHVLAGATHSAVWIRWALGCFYNFIISYNGMDSGIYPETPSAPFRGVYASDNTGLATVINANQFDCIIEGTTGNPLELINDTTGGNNSIRGLYENNIGDVIVKGGMRVNIHDAHIESGGVAADRNRLILQNHTYGRIGPAVYSNTPIDAYNDVLLLNADYTTIDGLSAARPAIDNASDWTDIQKLTLAAAVGTAALTDNSATTQWHQTMWGSATWNPGAILTKDYNATSIGVSGATVGMAAGVSASYDMQNCQASAAVTASGTVTVTVFNPTGGTKTFGSGTWKVWVMNVH